MESPRASLDLPPEADPDIKERFCAPCDRLFKSAAAKKSHDRTRHTPTGLRAPRTGAGPVEAHQGAIEPAAPSSMIMFYCRKAPMLHVVLKAARWGIIKTPVGEQPMLAEGTSIDFVNGQFQTDDVDIIKHLENRDGKGYRDPRWPIYSARLIAEEAERRKQAS